MTRLGRVAGWGVACAVLLSANGLAAAPRPAAPAAGRGTWLREARFGVMTHYLADWIARRSGKEMTVEEWNRLVDGFDVEGLAEQLRAVGAGYHVLTLGQNSGYYLSPNAAYDGIVGARPSRCSRRDLVADLQQALGKRGIRLVLYLPSGAPNRDPGAVAALEWTNGPHRNREFQLKWERVIREWSLRYGRGIAGWWFDGCYWPNTMYRSPEPPSFESFAAAARAGNPYAALAFNPGVVYRSLSVTPHEDYVAGEVDRLDRLSIRRAVDGKVDGAQVHVLSYLGQTWGTGEPRMTTGEAAAHSRKVAEAGGAITWDVPPRDDGRIPEAFRDVLVAVGRALPGRPAAPER